MTEALRVVVTGLAATYPFGGVFWDYAQYALGFLRLGHDVLYLEDTGQWCYDPAQGTFVEDGAGNACLLAASLERLDGRLAGRWFYRDARGQPWGRPWPDVAAFVRSADLFLNISAACWMREEYLAARRLAFLDSDPMYTQASVPGYRTGAVDAEARERVERLLRHDVFFTFGESVGRPECRIPTELFDWVPTRQPIVLDCFAAKTVEVARRRPLLTTVASWEPRERGPRVRGVQYGGKSREFLRFLDLPRACSLPLEVALTGPAPREELVEHGWRVRDGLEVSRDPWVYRAYLASSLGELSVAKNAYVEGRTGWFSCRTACYLALGVPAVVQDTGFSRHLPTGEGLFAFETAEEARTGIEAIRAEPERHARAAREIARAFFDSDRVLRGLLDRALGSPRVAAGKEAS
ncbi:MAG TPA: glycosyltransferase family 1 protein [Planctomycetota bacterium]|nr:glycosyltransferase family 1 protein [Planctomycetota bacterium]